MDFMSLMYGETFLLNNEESHFTNNSAHPTELLTNPFPIMPLLPPTVTNTRRNEHSNDRLSTKDALKMLCVKCTCCEAIVTVASCPHI